jgi:prephenate dehydrogenase
MKRLAIIGLGLMGGALGLAVRRRGMPWRVAASARRPETRALAIECGAADEVFATPQEAVRDADLVIFCLPVLSIPDELRRCREAFKPGATVTDVASTKSELCAAAEEALAGAGVHYVGSHPVCGSEQTGLEAARADLYENAVVAVTPRATTDPASVEEVRRFWADAGAQVAVMAPEDHDRMIARTSHLPHLVAVMLVESICAVEGERGAMLCGGGFRDTTRIAAGSADIWHDIVKTNRAAVGEVLDDFEQVVQRVRRMIRDGDFELLRLFLEEARRKRNAFGGLMRKKATRA